MLAFVLAVIAMLCARQPFGRIFSAGEDIEPQYYFITTGIGCPIPRYVVWSDFGLYDLGGKLVSPLFENTYWVVDERQYWVGDSSSEPMVVLTREIGDNTSSMGYYMVDVENYDPSPFKKGEKIVVIYIRNDVYVDICGDIDVTCFVPFADMRKFWEKIEVFDMFNYTEAEFHAVSLEYLELFQKLAFASEGVKEQKVFDTYDEAADEFTQADKPSFILSTRDGKIVIFEADPVTEEIKTKDGNPVVVGGEGLYDVDKGTLTNPDGVVTDLEGNLKRNAGLKQFIPTLVTLLMLVCLLE